MEKAVLFCPYHIGVNLGLINDFVSLGFKVYIPAGNLGRIAFCGDNSPFYNHPGCTPISANDLLTLPPMFLLAACVQQIDDFRRIKQERGNVDTLLWLTATQDAVGYPDGYADAILSQDIGYHRSSTVFPKMLYLNKPSVEPYEKDIRQAFDDKKINMYCNEITTHPRHAMILEDLRLFREHFPQTKFYGYQGEHGNLSRPQVHQEIATSMFTIGIKDWETWGQTVNESMLLKTPTIHLRKFTWNILKFYGITEDTAILCDTIDEVAERINNMSYNEYETMCWQAYSISKMLTNDDVRREQLNWLLNKFL